MGAKGNRIVQEAAVLRGTTADSSWEDQIVEKLDAWQTDSIYSNNDRKRQVMLREKRKASQRLAGRGGYM